MNKYSNGRWTFEVYTYFGRVLETFSWESSEDTHHAAGEKARKSCHQLNKNGTAAWVRLRYS